MVDEIRSHHLAMNFNYGLFGGHHLGEGLRPTTFEGNPPPLNSQPLETKVETMAGWYSPWESNHAKLGF